MDYQLDLKQVTQQLKRTMNNTQITILIVAILLVVAIVIYAKMNAAAKQAQASAELQKSLIGYKQQKSGEKTTFKDVLGGVEGLGKIAAVFA